MISYFLLTFYFAITCFFIKFNANDGTATLSIDIKIQACTLIFQLSGESKIQKLLFSKQLLHHKD